MNATTHSTRTIFVIGLSGSGRTTALNAFEDYGYDRIDNLPLGFIQQFVEASRNIEAKPAAIGLAPRDAEETAQLLSILTGLREKMRHTSLLFLTADNQVLLRRFSETRRRHPGAHDDRLLDNIREERSYLSQIKKIADALIDSSDLTPHQLKVEIGRRFDIAGNLTLSLVCESFSYKHGLPNDADFVFDCRFLRNPHWDEVLRPFNGRDARVQDFITADENYLAMRSDIQRIFDYATPAILREGRSYMTVAFGCSGGRHRSVFMAEMMNTHFRDNGWESHVMHRELKRLGEWGGEGE